ncbi:ABC transporter permease [Rhizobiales bacterium]|uniref:ABC transporter permease n=1 Tax=Hongsoonwoonella zoysiae TaxID=2821844 RepID=UPI0015600456|nr:ABC transporter permease [Hongsoonwoonella zoysiae]NRG19328.1 ABC transporter permease [Hongsoonwoonella zoysiae]
MLAYVLKRALSLIATLVVATAVVFIVLEVLPGDPAALMLGVEAREDTIAALHRQLGLDQPAPMRYAAWLAGLVTGDLGTSYTYSVPVSELVSERLAVTLPLALMALALSVVIAFPVAVIAARNRGRAPDTSIMALTQLGIAVPNFWFAILLVYVFAVALRLVPSGGFPGWSEGVGAAFQALTLPAVALALPQASILARVLRSALVDTLHEDYIRTARAKGLTRHAALWRHAVRNALIPVLTILGLQFSFLIAGTIIIENVFYLPGIGRLVFQAITQRDLIVVKSVVVLLVATVVIVTFFVDIAYAAVDPRLRRR